MSPDVIANTVAAALSAGAVSSADASAAPAIAERYELLHTLLRARYSLYCEAIEALEQLEERPQSDGRRLVLAEELRVIDLSCDKEVTEAVQALMELLRTQPLPMIIPASPQPIRGLPGVDVRRNQAV